MVISFDCSFLSIVPSVANLRPKNRVVLRSTTTAVVRQWDGDRRPSANAVVTTCAVGRRLRAIATRGGGAARDRGLPDTAVAVLRVATITMMTGVGTRIRIARDGAVRMHTGDVGVQTVTMTIVGIGIVDIGIVGTVLKEITTEERGWNEGTLQHYNERLRGRACFCGT